MGGVRASRDATHHLPGQIQCLFKHSLRIPVNYDTVSRDVSRMCTNYIGLSIIVNAAAVTFGLRRFHFQIQEKYYKNYMFRNQPTN